MSSAKYKRIMRDKMLNITKEKVKLKNDIKKLKGQIQETESYLSIVEEDSTIRTLKNGMYTNEIRKTIMTLQNQYKVPSTQVNEVMRVV